MAGDNRISLTSAPAAGAPDLWRGPEEWANTAEFRDMMTREFPDDVDTWTDPVTRRHFISIMGASIALAGFGCSPRPASDSGTSLSNRGNEVASSGRYSKMLPSVGKATLRLDASFWIAAGLGRLLPKAVSRGR